MITNQEVKTLIQKKTEYMKTVDLCNSMIDRKDKTKDWTKLQSNYLLAIEMMDEKIKELTEKKIEDEKPIFKTEEKPVVVKEKRNKGIISLFKEKILKQDGVITSQIASQLTGVSIKIAYDYLWYMEKQGLLIRKSKGKFVKK